MSILDNAYNSASTLLRDIYLYTLSGGVFLLILAVMVFVCPGIADSYSILDSRVTSFLMEHVFSVLFLSIFVVSYLLGHILFTVATSLFRSFYECIYRKLYPKTAIAESELECVLTTLGGDRRVAVGSPHIYAEMYVFNRNTDLHTKFIERYNILELMSRSLSASFFLSSILFFVISFSGSARHGGLVSGVVGFFLLACLSFLFFVKFKRAKHGFHERVYTGYLLTDGEPAKE